MLVDHAINALGEDELERITREELQEDEEEVNEAIDGIIEWINTCPHLSNARQDREFLR